MNDHNPYLSSPSMHAVATTHVGEIDYHDTLPALLPRAPAIPSAVRRIGRLTLRICSGPDTGVITELPHHGLTPRSLRGGRSPVGDIVLTDPRVDGAHFDLELGESRVLLRDLDSDGGVMLGGVRVREAWLTTGDLFTVGDTTIQLQSVQPIDVPLALTDHFGELYGRSDAMRSLFCELASLTERGDRLGVVIRGEPGTGKQTVARGLHLASMRGNQPFVGFDAALTPPEQASHTLCAQFERADGGTLHIEHVDALTPALQAQLYRILQEGGVTRPGEQTPRPVDVRVLCSTHADLRRLAADGAFRPELYFRVAGATLELPPLRARDGDIEFLAEHFLRRLVVAEQRTRRFDRDALAVLQTHPWPDNVLGLRTTVERGFFASEGESLGRADLCLHKQTDTSLARRLAGIESLFGTNHAAAVAGFERLYFRHLLRTHTSKAKATRTSGMTNEGFRLALRRLQLSSPYRPKQDAA